MLRAMQEQLNERTELYAKEYAGDKPLEQLPAPTTAKTDQERKTLERIQKELKDLSKSQDEVGRAARDIAEGKNKAN